jgi:hypothetical protein
MLWSVVTTHRHLHGEGLGDLERFVALRLLALLMEEASSPQLAHREKVESV